MLFFGIMVSWFLFFVHMDKKSVAMHLVDVWHSPVVQQKVKMVQRSVPAKLKDMVPVPHAVPSFGFDGTSENTDNYEEHNENERRGLDALVQKVERKPKQK